MWLLMTCRLTNSPRGASYLSGGLWGQQRWQFRLTTVMAGVGSGVSLFEAWTESTDFQRSPPAPFSLSRVLSVLQVVLASPVLLVPR